MDRSIVTKTGDKGDTSLMFGVRVPKDDIRVDSYGTIDELSAALGLARSYSEHEYIRTLILRIQEEMFIVGGELATPSEKLLDLKKRVTDDMVDQLELDVKEIETKHSYTTDWAMPGDHPSAAAVDVARTVCRRAERIAIHLYRTIPESNNPTLVRYLNRLSDLLWLMARWQEKEHNATLTSVRDFMDKKGISLKK